MSFHWGKPVHRSAYRFYSTTISYNLEPGKRASYDVFYEREITGMYGFSWASHPCFFLGWMSFGPQHQVNGPVRKLPLTLKAA